MQSQRINPTLVLSKTGYWTIKWSERAGKRYHSFSHSTRSKDRAVAEAYKDAFLTVDAQVEAMIEEPTVASLCDTYAAFLEDNRAGETQKISLAHVRAGLGDKRVKELRKPVIRAYCKERGVADGTLRREIGALKAALNHAVEDDVIQATDIPSIKLPPASKARHVYLPEADEIAFHRAAMAHSNGCRRLTRLSRFVALALCTAARKESIETLMWKQVDLVAGVIDYRGAGVETNKRQAVVRISKRLLPILQRAWDERKTEFVLDHDGSIRSQWRTWIETTPWEHIHPHDLRRTWATLATMHGVPIAVVAGVLGDTVATTLKHYAVFVPGASQDAVDVRWA
jgi:integrase